MKEIKHEDVSIIIPAFFSKEHLPRTLDSLINQTYKNFKAYIVDGSNCLETKELINRYRKKIDIVYFNNVDDHGPADARAKGIKLSKGKYIAFLDAGDFWTNNKLSDQISQMKKFSQGFTFSKTKVLDLDNEKISDYRHCAESYSFNEYLYKRGIVTSGVCIQRDLFKENVLDIILPHSGEETIWLQLILRDTCPRAYMVKSDSYVAYVSSGQSLSSFQLRTVLQQWKNMKDILNLNLISRVKNFFLYLVYALFIKVKLRTKPWKGLYG